MPINEHVWQRNKTTLEVLTLFLFFTLYLLAGLLLTAKAGSPALADSIPYKRISTGGQAGDYQAFSDACRLRNGDIAVVFYAGYGHVSAPNEAYPKGGRICMVRSTDEGKTWSKPVTIFDNDEDNRDPHISQLKDGTIIVSFFSLIFPTNQPRQGTGPWLIRSVDNGLTWTPTAQVVPVNGPWYCSAPVRELPDESLLLPVYYMVRKDTDIKAWGGVIRSNDKGKTWGNVVPIGERANLPLAAETDFIILKNKTFLAALRAQGSVPMHYATSTDQGVTWSAVKSIGFMGHSPSFTRLRSGAIILTYRGFTNSDVRSAYTALRISFDEGQTWQGPYRVDQTTGAYPSTVELKDGTVLVVYYEEGKNSAIRALRFNAPPDEHGAQFPDPKPLSTLSN